MNHSHLHEIAVLLGPDLIDRLYLLAGSRPVSFAALKKHLRNEEVTVAFGENSHNEKIVSHSGYSMRTIQRMRKAYYKALRNKPA